MKSRWYFGFLTLTFVVFGVVFQQQTNLANQQIVLEFTDVELSSDKAKSTIAIVEEQLQLLGVDDIQIVTADDALKITYYSDANIANVKRALTEKNLLVLDSNTSSENKIPSEFPSEDMAIGYNLNIYEIQKSSDSGWDFDGRFIQEFRPKSDRLFNPTVLAFIREENLKGKSKPEAIAFKTNRTIAIAIDNHSHKIPKVRAGPSI